MVNITTYVPNRGDIVWIDLNPQLGHEQSGRRPALVLSPDSYNSRTGLAILCPITSQVKGYPFEVLMPDNLKIKGIILSDQVKCLDWEVRNIEFLCKVPESVLREVQNKLLTLIK